MNICDRCRSYMKVRYVNGWDLCDDCQKDLRKWVESGK